MGYNRDDTSYVLIFIGLVLIAVTSPCFEYCLASIPRDIPIPILTAAMALLVGIIDIAVSHHAKTGALRIFIYILHGTLVLFSALSIAWSGWGAGVERFSTEPGAYTALCFYLGIGAVSLLLGVVACLNYLDFTDCCYAPEEKPEFVPQPVRPLASLRQGEVEENKV
ncbi:uncharacterized protein [Ptychodera flava]|uniref:uncharacterized protein n=1 Tax=Ptychodera flava TaxID=63121 RepID=UPI00396A0950